MVNKEFLGIKGWKKIMKYAELAILNSVFPNDQRKLLAQHQNGKYIWNI